MARKKVPRTLTALPAKRLLQQAHHKAERLTEILRASAAKNQSAQPRAFYSMRDISAHFEVPFATVSRVYHRLEEEGLLTRVRGSKTMLQGLQFDRRRGMRAFIGLPASLSAFVTIQAYRMFFIRIRRELRLRGFATGMVFFEKQEARTGSLSERLKAYEVDAVLWFQPPKDANETALRLRDVGIPVLGVAHEQVPGIPCRYHVRRDRAIAALLTEWKSRDSIDHVTVARWHEYSAPALDDALHSALDELGFKTSTAVFRRQRSQAFLRSLAKVKTGAIVFSSAQLVSMLCFRAPAAVTDLLKHRRVALLNGPASMPFAKVPDAQVDLVVVDWQVVAEQIVNDLITQDAFQIRGPTIFEADAKLRVPLSDFAQAI
jgi:DNA-binding LacI/PurR family transcriptional regulator